MKTKIILFSSHSTQILSPKTNFQVFHSLFTFKNSILFKSNVLRYFFFLIYQILTTFVSFLPYNGFSSFISAHLSNQQPQHPIAQYSSLSYYQSNIVLQLFLSFYKIVFFPGINNCSFSFVQFSRYIRGFFFSLFF